MTIFSQKVLDVVRKIKKGHTLTYRQVAVKSGYPNAYRAVGSVLRKNFDSTIPCHRVILSNGKVGRYNRGGENKKRIILEKEQSL